jgi:putative FmdB family regulatory protein
MAQYEYECKKCFHRFTVTETFQQHDKHKHVKCPKCGSQSTSQTFSSIHVKTSKKS